MESRTTCHDTNDEITEGWIMRWGEKREEREIMSVVMIFFFGLRGHVTTGVTKGKSHRANNLRNMIS